MQQAAFWLYIFQSRSRAWAKADSTHYSGTLRSSLNETVGGPINEWIGSDLNAWHDLAVKAIAYEKKFPFYHSKVESVPEKEWQELLEKERKQYEAEFNSAFEKLLAGDGKKYYEERKSKGLYVGPWQNPGAPLLEQWVK